MHYRLVSGKLNEHCSKCDRKKNISIDQGRSSQTNIHTTIQEIPSLPFMAPECHHDARNHRRSLSWRKKYASVQLILITTPRKNKRYLPLRGFPEIFYTFLNLLVVVTCTVLLTHLNGMSLIMTK
jgi:hypothetical protein